MEDETKLRLFLSNDLFAETGNILFAGEKTTSIIRYNSV